VRRIILTLVAVISWAGASLPWAAAAEPAPAKTGVAAQAEFEKSIRPVLAQNCVKCHGPKKQENGLRAPLVAAAAHGACSSA
jgi:mono/diheme cytochrome c family protein